MPRIVTYEQQTQAPGGQLTTQADGKSPVSDAVQELGQAGERLGGQLMQQGLQTDAKAFDVAMTEQGNDVLYHGDDPVMGRQGQAAVDSADAARARLRQITDQGLATLKPGARRLVEPIARARLNGWNEDLDRHVIQQRQAVDEAVRVARQQTSQAETLRYLPVDDARAMASLNSAESELDTRLTLAGQPRPLIEAARAQLRSNILASGVRAAMATDPHLAQNLLARHADKIDAPMAAELHAQVKGEVDRRDSFAAAEQQAVMAGDGLPDRARFISAVKAEAGKDADADRQMLFEQQGAARYEQIVANRAAARTGAISHAAGLLGDPKAPGLSAIPPQVWSGLPPQTKTAIGRFYAGGGRFPAADDPQALSELHHAIAEDPTAFAHLDPTAFATRLTRGSFQWLLGQQDAARTDAPAFDAQRAQSQRVLGAVRPMLDAVHITPENDPQAYARAQGAMLAAVGRWQAGHPGKTPTDKELHEIADGMWLGGG